MKIVILVCVVAVCLAAEERSFLDGFVGLLRSFKLNSLGRRRMDVQSPRVFRMLTNRKKLQDVVPESKPFPCDPTVGYRSKTVPRSVHKLRPGDIDVIGAMGDSLTAGFGLSATNLMGIAIENRGKSFSIGGEENWRTFFTLPNVLKVFNPKLIGYSYNTSLTIERASQFNVAEGGAVSKNMPYMAKVLITRIKNDKRVNLQKDWKMITFMIGDNDFCSEMCYSDLESTLKRHKDELRTVLRLLRDNLPRTIVNVIPPPHLKILTQMDKKPEVCELTHLASCPCLIGSTYRNNREQYFEFMRRWQLADIEVSNESEFDTNEFTVVPLMYTLNYTFPRTSSGDIDYSFLSEDCFHLSQKGNARFANDLWNNLMEPFGKKSTDGSALLTKFNCPTKKHPYIFTRRNSN